MLILNKYKGITDVILNSFTPLRVIPTTLLLWEYLLGAKNVEFRIVISISAHFSAREVKSTVTGI